MSIASLTKLSAVTIASIMVLGGIAEAGLPLPPAPPGLPAPHHLPAPPLLPAPGLSINLNAFIPPPPGVYVYTDNGRPYYHGRGHRRVYLEQRRPGRHYRNHHWKHHNGRYYR